MNFKQAFINMKNGIPMKRKGWGGYWYWDNDKNTIMIQCRPQGTDNGILLDIRNTKEVEFTLMNMQELDWEPASPVLYNELLFSFSDAIAYLKCGYKIARKGWNGKGQYIQLATGISYKMAHGEIVNCDHKEIGNAAIAFVGTSGVQMGWLASQADMLAEDWTFAE